MITTATTAAIRLQLRLRDALARHLSGSRDRGDVPGWVMITIMTAAIVTILWAFMKDTLMETFKDAVNGISGGGDSGGTGN